MARVSIGDKWGRVECVDDKLAERKTTTGAITETWKEHVWILQCDCGNAFEVSVADFPGKMRTKDCGCGLSAKDGGTVVFTVSAGSKFRDAVAEYAYAKKLRFSPAVVELAKMGLEQVESTRVLASGNDNGKENS